MHLVQRYTAVLLPPTGDECCHYRNVVPHISSDSRIRELRDCKVGGRHRDAGRKPRLWNGAHPLDEQLQQRTRHGGWRAE